MNDHLLKLYKLLKYRHLQKKEVVRILKLNDDSIKTKKKIIIYMYALISLDCIGDEIKKELQKSKYSITEKNVYKVMNILINLSDNINYLLPCYDSNLLIIAIINKYNEVAKLLIKKGIDLNYSIQTASINSALLTSILYENRTIFKVLLNNPNTNINLLNNEGRTALFYTIDKNKYYYASYLIDEGININHCDIYDTPVIKYAIEVKNIELIKKLIYHDNFKVDYINNIDNNLLFKLVDLNINKIITTLINKGLNIHNTNIYGIDLMYYLVINKKINLARLLLRHININKIYNNGDTLLLLAIKHNCISFAKQLISYKPNIYIKNTNGESILSLVKKLNNKNVISLIERHYNINISYVNLEDTDDEDEDTKFKNNEKIKRIYNIDCILDEYNEELNKIAVNLHEDTIKFLEAN